MSAQKPSGSFFNQVPENSDDDKEEGNDDASTAAPIESIEELIKIRNTKPLASNPSTLGGIPTEKATGFTMSQASAPKIINTAGDKKSFVGIGQPMNNINKPEYDDQGYTLYADEETGKKSRVFEALIDYPSVFKMKIIGRNESSFAMEMVQIVADSCGVASSDIEYSERANGKWLSVTVNAPVESAEMLYSLYENVDKDPRVKFKF